MKHQTVYAADMYLSLYQVSTVQPANSREMITNVLRVLVAYIIVVTSINQTSATEIPHISHFKKGNSELSSRTIYRITSDPYGYLWLATNEGLFIFNGSDFSKFYTPGNDIEFIAATRIDSFWYCFTYAGEIVEVNLLSRKSKLLRYMAADNKFQRPKINAFRFKDKVLIADNTVQLFEIVTDSMGQSIGYIGYKGKEPKINELFAVSVTDQHFSINQLVIFIK
jgi:hypothetical protein